jgi:hypothetical protein
VVSDYGLEDRAIDVRSPAGAKDFSSSLCVQTSHGAHLASCTMCTGVPFPGTKRGRGVTLTTHSHIVLRSRMSRSYTSCPPSATMACSGSALLFFCCVYNGTLHFHIFKDAVPESLVLTFQNLRQCSGLRHKFS